MNMRLACLLFTAAGLATALPSARVHSQLAPPPADPLADLQTMQTANDDLLKRQDATLKELTDLTGAAHEMKIFARRG